MSGHYEAPIREPLIIGHKTYHDITEDIARPIEEEPENSGGFLWAALVLFIYGFGCIAYTIGTGIGAWVLTELSTGVGILPTSYGG
jgi:molybdopterin-containing oxidoreductase family membrane subunit